MKSIIEPTCFIRHIIIKIRASLILKMLSIGNVIVLGLYKKNKYDKSAVCNVDVI